MSPLVCLALFFLRHAVARGENVVHHVLRLSEFFAAPDGIKVLVAGVNGEVQAPTVEVHRGDRLSLEVHNGLNVPMSIHVHGFEYRSEPYMDGVTGLTQCAIAPNSVFTYNITVNDYPGTYWYHPHTELSHLSSVEAMKGVLIVKPPSDVTETHVGLYDEEAVLFYTDWWHSSPHALYRERLGGQMGPLTTDTDGVRVGTYPFQGLLLNGKGGGHADPLPLMAEKRYRLRVLNGGSVYPLEFSIDGHKLLVVQTDGADTEPLEVDSIQLGTGERYDVIPMPRSGSSALTGKCSQFWVRAAVIGWPLNTAGLTVPLCAGGSAAPKSDPEPKPTTLNCAWDRSQKGECLPVTALRRHARAGKTYGWDHGVDDKQAEVVRHVVDARFTGGSNFGHFVKLDGQDRAGNVWTAEEFFAGNYVQGALPHLPPLVNGTAHLTPGSEKITLTAESGTTVELLLRSADKIARPWHMHGHKFIVLDQGSQDDMKACGIMHCFKGMPSNAEGTESDPRAAVFKDTAVIPAGGWLRIRFLADNPGWWIFNSHIYLHHVDGMAVIIRELGSNHNGYSEYHLPPDFPKCSAAAEPISCECFEDSNVPRYTSPLSSYTCTRSWMCSGSQEHLAVLGDAAQERADLRATGRAWRYPLAIICLVAVVGCLSWLLGATKALGIDGAVDRVLQMVLQQELGVPEARRGSMGSISSFQPADPGDVHLYFDDGPEEEGAPPAVFWQDLEVVSSTGQSIISGLNGQLRRGELLGLIGRSGAGKTTFLDVLANRGLRGGAQARGTLLLRGNRAASIPGKVFNEAVRYCSQYEPVSENLTVEQALAFGIAMRSPALGRRAVWDIARGHAPRFGLARVLRSRIANLSGGQKKRVAVALEMVKPAVLSIFDEPFSGLDSHTTIQLFDNIKEALKQTGSSVIMTVHTVPPQVFEKLDTIMALQRGKTAFFGPAAQVPPYCADTLQKPVAAGWMVCDHLLEVITEMDSHKHGHACETFAASKEAAAADGPVPRTPVELSQPEASLGQFGLLFKREWLQELPIVMSKAQAGQYITISLLIGWLFYGVGSSPLQRNLNETISLLFYTTTLWTFAPCYAAIFRMKERVIQIDVELKKGLFMVGPYTVAMTIADLLLHSIWPFVYAVITFAMADCGKDFGSFVVLVLLVMLCALAYQSFGVLLAVLVPSVSTSMAMATAFAQTTLVASGFYRTLPASIAWYRHFSLTTYVFRGFLRTSFSWTDSYQCNVRSMVDDKAGMNSCQIELAGMIDGMNRRGMNVATAPQDISPGVDVLVLVLFLLVSRFLVFLVLRRRLQSSFTNWMGTGDGCCLYPKSEPKPPAAAQLRGGPATVQPHGGPAAVQQPELGDEPKDASQQHARPGHGLGTCCLPRAPWATACSGGAW